MNELIEFSDNLYMWKQFEDFYELYPDHPCRVIHEEVKKKLVDILEV